jgi:DNA-binding MarR family transcriptional regulator
MNSGQTEPDVVDQIIDEWREERPDVDASSIGVFGRISRLQPLQRVAMAALHERHGLSVAAFDVLASLRRSGPPFRKTVGELAASSLLTSSAVTLRLDNLERDGLVRRVRTGGDRRQVFAELTDDGRARIDAIFEEHIALEQRMMRLLDRSEQAELARLLRKLSLSVRTEASTGGDGADSVD